MDKQMLGIINAGEENRKLKDLVRSRSLSALPVGGRYRTVDFMLSNVVDYIFSHHISMMHLHLENTQVLWTDFVEHLDS